MTQKQSIPQYAVVLPALWHTQGSVELHAVTVALSTLGIRLRSVKLPIPDTKLTCRIRDVGSVEARVTRVGMCDFDIAVISRTPSPGEIARRLIELSRQQTQQADFIRLSRRIVPEQSEIWVTPEAGTAVLATILNLSSSGVALKTDLPLAVGDTIMVGSRQAVVARQLTNGIGAAFINPFDEGTVNHRTVL